MWKSVNKGDMHLINLGLGIIIVGGISFVLNIQIIYFWLMNNNEKKFKKLTLKTMNMTHDFWKYMFNEEDYDIPFIRRAKKLLNALKTISPICLLLGFIIIKKHSWIKKYKSISLAKRINLIIIIIYNVY